MVSNAALVSTGSDAVTMLVLLILVVATLVNGLNKTQNEEIMKYQHISTHGRCKIYQNMELKI